MENGRPHESKVERDSTVTVKVKTDQGEHAYTFEAGRDGITIRWKGIRPKPISALALLDAMEALGALERCSRE